MRELSRVYEPAEVEQRVYAAWRERGAFAAPASDPRPPYCITIPPPNVTGELHMGHALQHTVHDVLVRRRRMLGCNTLCLPGTDHAGIGTNMKVEQALRAEGQSRWSVGRAGFVARARAWTLQYGGTILGQLQALGCSYDWSRLRFTLDEFVEDGPETAEWALGKLYTRSGYARAVLEAFVRFHQRGWIYRAERIVNWCPQCQTTLSELEMEHREVSSHLWYLRYPEAGGGEGLVVATTRPETMLGDTGVAVSPGDERYRRLVGHRLLLPLVNREIPVVADPHVDPAFGTGAVKVTPAHDPHDWEIAQRHAELLPPVRVLDDCGVCTAEAGGFAGLGRAEARRRVVDALREQGLLVRVEDYAHSVGHHDKCGTVVEPLLKLQWWVRCDELAARALSAIESRRVRFVPERFATMTSEWLRGIRPWCVSRQQWWGHRIPLYYCRACDGEALVYGAPGSEQAGELVQVLEGAAPIAAVEPPGACPRCGGAELAQDPDVLDTWFSSALWPHATLGWPAQTDDLARFYPTDLMITGRDILYLWVARMIMTGEEFLGREPFREVLVHATVLTEDGRRMSKSLGTGVDPLELIRLYGADATRLGLASLATDSQDIRFKVLWASGGRVAAGSEDRLARAEQIEQMRNFCNKLWNVSRFVLMNIGEEPPPLVPSGALREGEGLQLADRWILSRLAGAVERVNGSLARYELGEAAWTLYHFVWDELADWYVELAKPRLRAGDEVVRQVLMAVLEETLRLAHPFIPFLTEELWQALPGTPDGALLMLAPYPNSRPEDRDAAAEEVMGRAMEVVRAARNLKAEQGLGTRQVELWLEGDLGEGREYVAQLARGTLRSGAAPEGAARTLAGGIEVALLAEGGVDRAAEASRLRRELATVERELGGLQVRLESPGFLERAPDEVVAKSRARQAELSQRRELLAVRLRAVGDPESEGRVPPATSPSSP